MAFFKFRLPTASGTEAQASHTQPASGVDVMRRRARHRLIGSAVLVLVAVIVFPIVFDTQPRPISADVSIDIPDRNKTKPVSTPKTTAPIAAASSLNDKEELVNDQSSAAVAQSKVAAVVPTDKLGQAAPPQPKPETRVEAKPDTKAQDTKNDNKAITRFIVQVGAFADETKAHDVRAKLEKAGLKTYTHVAETKDGKRIRVRLGPFSSREEADKTAAKIRQLQMQPQVLTL